MVCCGNTDIVSTQLFISLLHILECFQIKYIYSVGSFILTLILEASEKIRRLRLGVYFRSSLMDLIQAHVIKTISGPQLINLLTMLNKDSKTGKLLI